MNYCHLKEPTEADIIIVKEDNMSRSSWKLGKIMHLIPGRDLKVQSTEIQLPSRTTISRYINYLYPLEILVCEKLNEKEGEGNNK